jgi:hypothetical protein
MVDPNCVTSSLSIGVNFPYADCLSTYERYDLLRFRASAVKPLKRGQSGAFYFPLTPLLDDFLG